MITIKKPEEIEILRQSGRILASTLQQVVSQVKPGVLTSDLDQFAEKLIRGQGGQSSFKNYVSHGSDPFPSSLCTSINEEIVHAPAIPSRPLKDGDIIGLDLGVNYKGFFTDMAVTVGVGRISAEAKNLMKATKKSLELALKQVKPGNYIHDISNAVQRYVEKQGYGVVRELVGHGVGYQVHEDPRIPNYLPDNGEPERIELKEGMVLAIEPMVTAGHWKIKTLEDGWTAVTIDGKLSAHFELTVAVTAKGYEILTK
ncbi:MAG TPA: type I methionyl aminopeptidase [Patescibacteria group bacterium]